MKRETITDLWVLGIVLLALSVIIPFPWIEMNVEQADTGIVVYEWIVLSDISTKTGPYFNVTLALLCAAILIGALFISSLFRWSIEKQDKLWYWGEIPIALIILAIIVFNIPHPIYGHEGQFGDELVPGDTNYYNVSWYPHVGFYLTIISLVILGISQFLFRRIQTSNVKKGI